MAYSVIDSPIGLIGIATDDFQVVGIHLGTSLPSDLVISDIAVRAAKELKLYFAGKLQHFTVPFRIEGTPFQQSVRRALLQIPYGTTVSYHDVATMIGHPKACRAVGSACASNDVCLIIPCHRVIKSGGSIGRFGSDSKTKQWLIEMEESHR